MSPNILKTRVAFPNFKDTTNISSCANLSDSGCSGKSAEFQVGAFEQELVPVLQLNSATCVFSAGLMAVVTHSCMCLMHSL